MLNYGIFTNFMFCKCYLKKERKQAENKQENVENAAVFAATKYLSRAKELCRCQQLNVITNLRKNSLAEREIFSRQRVFPSRHIEQDCEKKLS